ncbi:hypothetical protein HDU91_003656 [Kappamyces sp. JEL0680]|nr:hypothetical protein HDU91_003656 [Kappamyces sp. JEL0680]
MHGTGWDSDDDKYTWRGETTVDSSRGRSLDILNDPWKQVQQPTPIATPKPSLLEVEQDPAPLSGIEAIKAQLQAENPPSRSSQEEAVFGLDATAEQEELVEKALTLQRKIKCLPVALTLAAMLKVFSCQQDHQTQVVENLMLKEYVQNLLSSASTQGTDRFGRPIASGRTSSLSR